MNKTFLRYALAGSLIFSASLQINKLLAAVDLKNSTVTWEGGKKVVDSKHYGKISLSSAELNEKDGKIVDGKFVIDLNSFTVEDITDEKMKGNFLGHMKSGDFFHVEKYPTATFVIKSTEYKNANEGVLKGDMTLKGVTKPVELPFKKSGNTFTGSTQINRTLFGITYGSDSFFKGLGDKVIKDEFTIGYNITTL